MSMRRNWKIVSLKKIQSKGLARDILIGRSKIKKMGLKTTKANLL